MVHPKPVKMAAQAREALGSLPLFETEIRRLGETISEANEISQKQRKREENQFITPTQERSLTKKRGRPATGKRSDPNWIGRTYYIRKETDLDIEDELIKLKRADINLDKSELVDFLLDAWVKWRKGENIDFYISEISPRQKDESP
ncbi:MAG: hypothetical protein QNJ54_33170 [Prochloraceae cyanobacterium]|nr:hypothetical protein [Prochloraceae cyanobacterium]